ncbi:uncharacterized protein VTP21DRAFT_1810 [Calcarisporiella thermophila]|uniref:uncharacterized protein n=1 Tax=Calcarisporiella thermophila TaxID=911321 RepID=UPI003743817A
MKTKQKNFLHKLLRRSSIGLENALSNPLLTGAGLMPTVDKAKREERQFDEMLKEERVIKMSLSPKLESEELLAL